MSGYNGRRAPNVSQYIANLNTIPSAAESAIQPDFGNFQEELDLFTNTQFFDYDLDETAPTQSPEIAFTTAEQPRPQQALAQLAQGPTAIDFVNQPNFQFQDFAFGQPQSQPARLSEHSIPPSPATGLTPYPAANPLAHHQHALYASSPVTGDKRKASAASPEDYDESSRAAAEEDKRRRNTAASARFRVKKKQREQALEKNAKEMSDKVSFLEARVGQLEMENKWLKGLITEKNLKGRSEATSPRKVSTKQNRESSSPERKDGVGTAANSEVVAL